MKKEYIHDLIAALFITLFLYTSLSKLIDYDRFVFQMRLAPITVMVTWAPFLGYVVPFLEVAIVITLIAGLYNSYFRCIGLISGTVLLIAFEVYIGYLLLSGYHLPCTCGGIISKMSWHQHFIFNAVFIIIGFWSLLSGHPSRFANDRHKDLFAR